MKLYLFACLLFSVASLNGYGQSFSVNKGLDEKYFLVKVKQVDEFMERFNDVKTSFLRENLHRYYPKLNLTRPILVELLFDNQNSLIRTVDIKSFIKAVNNPLHPAYLYFNDSNWFAEAICVFKYKMNEIEIPVFLRVNASKNESSKWMICAIHSKLFGKYKGKSPAKSEPRSEVFMSPMCHATNFICLANAFDSSQNLADYLEKSFYTDSLSLAFYQAFKKEKLEFQYVKRVRYHFQEIKGWLFTVDLFEREENFNSGWLISSLKRSELSQKQYLNSLN